MRLTGKRASLYLGVGQGIKIGDCFDCTVKMGNSFVEASAWGDNWDINIPTRGNWSVTARKYAITGNIGYFMSQAARTPAAETAQTPITVIVWANDGVTKVFEGTGWVEDGDIMLPKDLIEENLTIRGTGNPAYVSGYAPPA